MTEQQASERAEEAVDCGEDEYGFFHKNIGDKTKYRCIVEHVAQALISVHNEAITRAEVVASEVGCSCGGHMECCADDIQEDICKAILSLKVGKD